MFKTISVSLLSLTLLIGAAQAGQCPTFPSPLTNGTAADATGVMNDLQYLQDCPALGTNPYFSGNFGIGITSPDSSLDIQSTSADSHLHIGSVAPSIHLMNATSNAGSTATGLLSLTTTTGQYGLYTGDVMLAAYGNSHGNIYINSNYSGGGTTNVILQPTSGNVGIGITNPSAKLEIASSTLNGIRLDNGSNTTNIYNDGNFHIEGGPLWFNQTSNSNILMAVGGGRVAIGTTGPTNLLTVGNNSPSIYGMASANSLVNIAGWGGLYELWTTGIGGRTNWGLAREYANGGDIGFLRSSAADGTPDTTVLYMTGAGNVGIGTTVPNATLQVNGTAVVGSSASGATEVALNSGGTPNTKDIAIFYASGSPSSPSTDYGVIQAIYQGNYYTNLSLNADGGNVGIGTTTPAEALDTGTGIVRANGFRGRTGIGGSTSNVFNINWTGSAAQLWIDYTNVGTLSTVSDRRLKQQITTEPDTALSRVMQLRPVTFHWRNADIFRDDGVQHEGFIADELQAVIPSAVVNKKDQVDSKGKPVYQSIVPSEIIAVLTKALQEQQNAMQAQQAEIDTLKSQIAALHAAQSTVH